MSTQSNKFKVGDRVRITMDPNSEELEFLPDEVIGAIGIVKSVGDYSDMPGIEVDYEEFTSGNMFYESELSFLAPSSEEILKEYTIE